MHAPLLHMVPWLMAGIATADAFGLQPGVWAAAVVLLAAMVSGRRPLLQTALAGVCMMMIGMTLTGMRREQLQRPAATRGEATEAVVMSEPTMKRRSVAVDLLLVGSHRRVKAYLQPDARSRALQPATGIVLTAPIRPVGHYHVGNFDYGRYLFVSGFCGQCYAKATQWRLQPEAWNRLSALAKVRGAALRWRSQLLQRLRDVARDDGDAYGVLAAMTLGDKSGLSRDLREVYSLTGTSHILALSGLHMGILFSLVALMMRPGRRSAAARLLTVALFWAFAVMTGLSTSVVRSALMLSLLAVLSLRSRDRLSLNMLSLAAIVMLLANPYALYDIGFQLSFGAVLSIIVLLPVINGFWSEAMRARHHIIIRRVWPLVSLSLASQIGTAPLVAYHFGKLSVLFLLTNLVAIPAAYAILWLCLAYMVWPLPLTGELLTGTVRLLNGVLTTMASWPGASFTGLQPSAWQVVLCYVAIAAVAAVLRRLQSQKPMVVWPR